MARGVNKAILLGNVGKDPELRYTQNGTAVANFTLATTEHTKRQGEWTDHTEWHNIVAWGKLAETCGNYLTKGSQIYLEGRIQTRKWEDRDGNTRYSTEVVAREMTMLGGGKGKGQQPQQGYAPPPLDDDPFGGGPSNAGGGGGGGQGGGGPDQGFDPNDDVPF